MEFLKRCIVMYGIDISVHILSQELSLKSFKPYTISPHNRLTFLNQVIIWNIIIKTDTSPDPSFFSNTTNMLVWSKMSLNIFFRIHYYHLYITEIVDATSAGVHGIKCIMEDHLSGVWYNLIQIPRKDTLSKSTNCCGKRFHVWQKGYPNRSFRIPHYFLNLLEIYDAMSAGVQCTKLIIEHNISGGCFTVIQSTGK